VERKSTSTNWCCYLTLQNETLSEPLHNNTKNGQNFTKKSHTSVSAYCWVVYSSSKSWHKSY